MREYIVLARRVLALMWVVAIFAWQVSYSIYRANRRRRLRLAARRWA